jgi:arylsulfatase A
LFTQLPDIYPTVLSLAGGVLPTDRIFDGKDLSSMLLSGGGSPHKCIFHWHDSELKQDGKGLSAVRCGDIKAHFYTQGDYAKQANRSKAWPVGKQDPPLLFNLTADATETENIDPKSVEYAVLLGEITSARDEHVASIVPVCSQDIGPCGGQDASYAVCGDPNSTAKYPQWPRCTISPENWAAKPCI